jgi:two-component system, OmpR family, response regulator MprA
MPEAAILVVDDDAPIRRMLDRTLSAEGYAVETVADGGAALASVERSAPDLVVLDVAMPGVDGLAVSRRLRAKGLAVPVLLLTARDSVPDRVAGLDAGADDYLVKPFAFEELSARLRALSRRGAPAGRRTDPKLVVGPITLDETARRVTVEGATVDLSPREFSLLECLLRHPGQTLSRDQLLDQAWPFGVAVTPNAVDAYIHYLRDKLGSAGQFIQTVRGVGYRLADA